MSPTPSALRLAPGQCARLAPAPASRLTATAGTLWVTIDHDPRDIVLEAGEGVALRGDAPVFVSPLGGAAAMALTPAAARHAARGR